MASGDTLAVFMPIQNEPPATNYATLDTLNNRYVLDFDGGAAEDALFSSVMPRKYGGGNIEVYLHLSLATSETSKDVDFDIYFERLNDAADMSSDSFGTINSINDNAMPNTANEMQIINGTCTNLDSIAAGDHYRIKVTRDAVSDTSTGDCQLHAIELKEA